MVPAIALLSLGNLKHIIVNHNEKVSNSNSNQGANLRHKVEPLDIWDRKISKEGGGVHLSLKSIIVARSPEVGISMLIDVVSKLEKSELKPIPLIFPMHYDLLAFDWKTGSYDTELLLKFVEEKIGFENIPIIFLTSGDYINEPYYCSKHYRICLLNDEKKLDVVLAELFSSSK